MTSPVPAAPPDPPALRVGQGFDMHGFSDDPGRPLVLGGVTVPDGPGLAGHSDADVVCHALADALLGAAGLGDLGRHFPATAEFARAQSTALFADVVAMVRAAGYVAVHADCTVVAERPRLAAFTDDMAARLGGVLGAPVSVKATSTDGLGAIGRGEGIAAMAVVLLTATGAR
ncbi:MAG TPA: 2-C-methyl-D-erythritol 2,4-cyclodiphosphate synthase [Acidimicrobiales bacterium]|nr:2-C-methyl-D-erythritol 2,4-cyclodiphosphate synthase [Acidimicrobiales bacterium]